MQPSDIITNMEENKCETSKTNLFINIQTSLIHIFSLSPSLAPLNNPVGLFNHHPLGHFNRPHGLCHGSSAHRRNVVLERQGEQADTSRTGQRRRHFMEAASHPRARHRGRRVRVGRQLG